MEPAVRRSQVSLLFTFSILKRIVVDGTGPEAAAKALLELTFSILKRIVVDGTAFDDDFRHPAIVFQYPQTDRGRWNAPPQ